MAGEGSCYKLVATTNGDGVAAMDIRADGVLTGLFLSATVLVTAVGVGSMQMEVSWIPTGQQLTNDTTSAIATLNLQPAIAEQAATANIFVPCNLKVNAGERLYLNIRGIAVDSLLAYASIFIDDKALRPSRVRR